MADALTALLQQLGLSKYASDIPGLLRPGPTRMSVLERAIGRLLQPCNIAYLLLSIPAEDIPEHLSTDEQLAMRYMLVLQQAGVHTCIDDIRGSGSSLAARALLQQLLTLAVEAQRISQQAAHLAQLAAHQHQCTQQQFTQQKQLSPQQQRSCMQDASSSQQAVPPSSMLSPPQQGSSTARTTARQSLAGAVAGASGSTAGCVLECVAAEARLAREAGLRAATLCSEGAALFPSDILQAARQAQPSEASPLDCAALTQQMAMLDEALRQRIDLLGEKVTLSSDAQWSDQLHRMAGSLSSFLHSAASSCDTYETSLSKWCASVEEVQMAGLGPAAAELLQRYKSLSALSQHVAHIRRMYCTITLHEPPLQGLAQLEQQVSRCQAALHAANTEADASEALLTRMRAAAATAGQ